ncbi:Oleate-activated transcription factor 1 [Nakaseomyces bracarensis]|uniref:Oleate-activated transcription factor 1 n=1 Tax=Nakaseomyces bracarensis TaxID=273131 RepID=A0ABR4NTF9_9SACH
MSLMESEVYDHSKKRNRLSFVCQGCRRAKTKCDKEKPACTRCVKQGLKCVYDLAKQKPPKNPNKDALITRLEKELSYWKKKTLKLSKKQPKSSTHMVSPSAFALDPNLAYLKSACKDIEIDIFRTHPRLIISKVIKREINPLSENYMVIQDKFLTTAFASVFINSLGGGLLSALASDMSISQTSNNVKKNISSIKQTFLDQCQNELQQKRINLFIDKLVPNIDSAKPPEYSAMMGADFLSPSDKSFVEDYCPVGVPYSELFQSLVISIKDLLPPYDIIMAYKKWFFDNVYYTTPYFDRSVFESNLSKVLFKDEENGGEAKLVFGNSNLRSKLETLCLLLLALKLAYTSIILTEDDVEKYNPSLTQEIVTKFPISNDVAHVVQKCLCSENWCSCPNENIISCLLLLWAFFIFSPDEGDFFFEQPTMVLANVAFMLAVSIGLHKDPNDYEVLETGSFGDKRVRNQRRLLWIALVCVLTFEANTKGSLIESHPVLLDLFIDLRDPSSVFELLDRVKKDYDPQDEYSVEIVHLIENFYRRTQMAYALYDLNSLMLAPEGKFTMSNFEQLTAKLHLMSKEYLDLITTYTPKHGPSGDKSKLPIFYTKNSCDIFTGIMLQLMNLRASAAICLHFEERLCLDEEVRPHYSYFFTKTCLDTVALVNTIQRYFDGTFDPIISRASDFIVKKAIQVAIPTVFFSLLTIIMRFELSGSILFNEYQTSHAQRSFVTTEMNEINAKIQLLNVMKKTYEDMLKNIYWISSSYLRFEYFTVFKMLTLFDVILDRIQKNQLWMGILKMAHLDVVDAKIAKVLEMTLRVRIDENNTIVEDMQERCHLPSYGLDHYNTLCHAIMGLQNQLNASNILNVVPETKKAKKKFKKGKVEKSDEVYIKSEVKSPTISTSTVHNTNPIPNSNTSTQMPPNITANNTAPSINFSIPPQNNDLETLSAAAFFNNNINTIGNDPNFKQVNNDIKIINENLQNNPFERIPSIINSPINEMRLDPTINFGQQCLDQQFRPIAESSAELAIKIEPTTQIKNTTNLHPTNNIVNNNAKTTIGAFEPNQTSNANTNDIANFPGISGSLGIIDFDFMLGSEF